MDYDFSKLRGKIVEVFGTVRKFADAMGWSETTCYNKINGQVYWKQDEISKAVRLLSIPEPDIPAYFFALYVEKNSTAEVI